MGSEWIWSEEDEMALAYWERQVRVPFATFPRNAAENLCAKLRAAVEELRRRDADWQLLVRKYGENQLAGELTKLRASPAEAPAPGRDPRYCAHGTRVNDPCGECIRAEAPSAAAGEQRCRKCGGSGYAVNCGPLDRERGDLWACSGCEGAGWVETAAARPESTGPIDAKALGKRIADEVMASGLVDRLIVHGPHIADSWAASIADECERQISAEIARLRRQGETGA